MNEKYFKKMINISLFNGIDEKELKKLISQINIYEKKYDKDTVVILQGMPYKALFIIIASLN